MWVIQRFKKQAWTKNLVLFISFAVRVVLIGYACLHDYFFKVDFTDIDYQVFSDAAKHVSEGRSPYERATYRYTPLLAWVLLPNKHWKDFGKLLFCFADVAVGWMLFKIMEERIDLKLVLKVTRTPEEDGADNRIKLITVFWLANPLTTVISARGNADALVCASVLLCLYLLQHNRDTWVLSALVHGIGAVHLKIYPLIYLPSIFIYLSFNGTRQGIISKIDALVTNVRGYAYAIVSLLSLFLIMGLFYNIYGDVFLEEFLFYHLKRTDTRHNFSPYFLPLYLIGDDAYLLNIVGLGAFIPQLLSIFYFAFKYHSDLPFCWFLTTYAFVTFNKVCTSQYFIWYIVFLPLVCQRIQMTVSESIFLISLWFGGQGIWLFFAYLFEFEGYDVLNYIWIASIVFLLINCYIIKRISTNYVPISRKSKTE